jgi:hypothetical protein
MQSRLAREDAEPPSIAVRAQIRARFKLRFPLLLIRPPALPAFFVGAALEPVRPAPIRRR